MIFRPLPYALSIIGLGIVVAVIFYLLERFAGLSMPSTGASAVVPMLAAMLEGQAYVKRTQETPVKSDMWRAAFYMGFIGLGVSLAVGALLLLFSGSNLMGFIGEIGFGVLALVLVLSFIVQFLLSRLGYGLGVRNQLKARK